MCFISDAPEFVTETWPKARKEHQCYECCKKIQVGDFYYRVSGKWDEMQSFSVCLNCEEIRKKIFTIERSRGCSSDESVVPFGLLREVLGDYPELTETERGE